MKDSFRYSYLSFRVSFLVFFLLYMAQSNDIQMELLIFWGLDFFFPK